jgi:hypothetical protein
VEDEWDGLTPTGGWTGLIVFFRARFAMTFIPAQPVALFDNTLRDLASDLLETMHAAPGVGITAPQET